MGFFKRIFKGIGKVFRKIGLEALSDISKVDIIYHWSKATFINIMAPSIILDKNIRSLPHPSFYETGNILLWIKLLLENKEYHKYLLIVSIAFISCLFTITSLIVGMVYFFKNDKMIFYLTFLYILYFSIITGPVLSPKYIFPILPCIFLYQGITLYKIFNFFKTLLFLRFKNKSN